MTSTQIDSVLLDEPREKFNTGFNMMLEAWRFLIDLNAHDRAEVKKFGEKWRSLVVKARAGAHPTILPPSFDLALFRKDVELVENLQLLHNAIVNLSVRVDDTDFATGGKAHAAAPSAPQYAKRYKLATSARHHGK